MVYRGVAHGKIIELDEALPLGEGQRVSISVEPLNGDELPGSPQAILTVMRGLPDIDVKDVESLEAAIAAGRLPMSEGHVFDDESADSQA